MYHADDEKSTSSRGDFFHGDYCDSDNDSSNERNAGGNSSGALSSSLSSIREDRSNSYIDIGEENAKWVERRQPQVGIEGETKLQVEEQTKEQEKHKQSCAQAQHVKYHECSANKHKSNKQQINTSNATSRASTKTSTSINTSLSPPPRPPFTSANYVDAPGKERIHLHSNPPAHSKIKNGVTTDTTVFTGYPSSSFVTRSSNNSSSSQKPWHYSKEEEGSSTEKRQISPSDMDAFRECATYVTRVKTTLLASNHDDNLNIFLDLLCNWSEQGLSSDEVFSQMQLILQEESPDLLADFTAFLPVDTQEKARLHITAASSMMSINRAYEGGTQAISTTSNNRLDDTDNGEMVQEQGYSP